MFKFKKGFTLIEFIIVMAIIGILVLMASPKFLDYVERAKETQIKNDTKVVENILKAKMAENIANGDNKILFDENGKISSEVMDDVNTKLDKDQFYYNDETDKVYYKRDNGNDNEKEPEVKDPEKEEVNKDEIKRVILESKDKLSGNYTEETKNNLEKVINESKEIMNKDNVTQEEINKAIENINKAIEDLIEKKEEIIVKSLIRNANMGIVIDDKNDVYGWGSGDVLLDANRKGELIKMDTPKLKEVHFLYNGVVGVGLDNETYIWGDNSNKTLGFDTEVKAPTLLPNVKNVKNVMSFVNPVGWTEAYNAIITDDNTIFILMEGKAEILDLTTKEFFPHRDKLKNTNIKKITSKISPMSSAFLILTNDNEVFEVRSRGKERGHIQWISENWSIEVEDVFGLDDSTIVLSKDKKLYLQGQDELNIIDGSYKLEPQLISNVDNVSDVYQLDKNIVFKSNDEWKIIGSNNNYEFANSTVSNKIGTLPIKNIKNIQIDGGAFTAETNDGKFYIWGQHKGPFGLNQALSKIELYTFEDLIK